MLTKNEKQEPKPDAKPTAPVPPDSLRPKLKELSRLPSLPGVYLMKNNQDKVLYVGKAKNIRSRVRSYFSSSDFSLKNRFLIHRMKKVDYIVTANEEEAFLLEASLIKKHRPRYNVRLKDDKAYPYIRLSAGDSFPRLYFERKVRDRKSLYFGPYTQIGAVRAVMDFLNHTFQLRDCTDSNFKTRERPCLTHQMGFCTAPCVNLVEQKDYRKQFQGALRFLRGRHSGLVKNLRTRMERMAQELKFEEAARLRESLKAVEMMEQSRQVMQNSDKDRDVVFALSTQGGFLTELLHLRKGRLIGTRHRFFKIPFDEEAYLSFLNQYYGENLIPDEILVSPPLQKNGQRLLQKVLSLRKQSPCRVRAPEGEAESALTALAGQNAENHLKDEIHQERGRKEILREIQKKFHLPSLPLRMECYDISHWRGKGTVGSQAVFENGEPKREDYRLYGLRESAPSDDYGSLREVLTRRLLHTEYEDPHLLIIDGGKGQLRAGEKVLQSLGRGDIPLVSLAKDRPFPSEEGLARPDGGGGGPVVEKSFGARAARRPAEKRDEALKGKTFIPSAAAKQSSVKTESRVSDNEMQNPEKTESRVSDNEAQNPEKTEGRASDNEAQNPEKTESRVSDNEAQNPEKTESRVSDGGQKTSSVFSDTPLSTGERFYLPGRKNPVTFKSSPAFHLLLHIRDEAHRFALKNHRRKRDKQLFSGALDQIAGLGPKRKRDLLRKFGSVEGVKRAEEKQLASLPSISLALARKIKETL